jgi:hypothetical protein
VLSKICGWGVTKISLWFAQLLSQNPTWCYP